MSDNVFPSTAPNSAARAIGCYMEPPAKSPKGWMPPLKRQYSDATPRNLLERIRKVTPWDVDRWEDDANLASMLQQDTSTVSGVSEGAASREEPSQA